MSESVLVRSSLRTWDLTLVLLVGIGLFVWGWFVFENGDRALGIAMQVIGGATVVGSAVGLHRRKKRRQWIRIEEGGFVIVDHLGESQYDDDQVKSLALHVKANYSNGVKTSDTRTVRLWVENRESVGAPLIQLQLTNKVKLSATDPLVTLINRLSQLLLDRARQSLSSGGTLAGDGWEYSRTQINVLSKADQKSIPLTSIDATGVVDDRLCLWCDGREDAWLRIDISSINAYILKWLLDEQLATRPAKEPATIKGGELGRIIFERKPRVGTWFVWCLGAFTLSLVALGLLFGAVQEWIANKPADAMGMGLFGLGGLVGMIVCVLGAINNRMAKFRCHQYGLVKSGVFGRRTLRYEHVDAFTYQATRHYHNGAYTGTIFVLDFVPKPEQKSQRIRYSVTLQRDDGELENLRDQVSAIIGAHMRRDVEAGEQVVWTPNLVFDGRDLLYTSRGFLKRQSTITIPVDQIASYNFHQGECFLFRTGETAHAARESTQAQNFFPGFTCLLGLINTPIQDAEEVIDLAEPTE